MTTGSIAAYKLIELTTLQRLGIEDEMYSLPCSTFSRMPCRPVPTCRILQRCCRAISAARFPIILPEFNLEERPRRSARRVRCIYAVSSPEAYATPSASLSVHMEKCIPGFLRWVRECNDGGDEAHQFISFSVEGQVVGYLRPQ